MKRIQVVISRLSDTYNRSDLNPTGGTTQQEWSTMQGDNPPPDRGARKAGTWPDWMIRRAQALPGPERALVMLYLEGGGPYRRIASVVGLNEGTVARRIKRCLRRLSNDPYAACLQQRHRLTRTQLGIARDWFLESMSIPRIAVKRGLTTYRVRQALDRIVEVIGPEDRKQKAEAGSQKIEDRRKEMGDRR